MPVSRRVSHFAGHSRRVSFCRSQQTRLRCCCWPLWLCAAVLYYRYGSSSCCLLCCAALCAHASCVCGGGVIDRCTVFGNICEPSKSHQISTFFAPTLWLKCQLSFQHSSELSNLGALLRLALHRLVALEKVQEKSREGSFQLSGSNLNFRSSRTQISPSWKAHKCFQILYRGPCTTTTVSRDNSITVKLRYDC